MFINVIKIQVVTKARPITNAALSLVRPGGRVITTLPFSHCFFSILAYFTQIMQEEGREGL